MNWIIKHIAKYRDLYYFKRYRKVLTKNHDIKAIIRNNRKYLSLIDKWIEDDIYENSLFHYGLPQSVKHLIDKPINNEVIYTDILAFFGSQLNSVNYLNYLELGVSVGKNFFLIANHLRNSSLTGFDIEEINPTLEQQLNNKTAVAKWATAPESIKKDASTLTSYDYKNNYVFYLSGDIFDEQSWEKLKGKKFNLIFSDAYHSPKALAFEYKMMKKYDLIANDNFVILYDDLGNTMTQEFLGIFKDMRKRYSLNSSNISINYYNGWLGQHEHKHLNGLIFKIS